MNRTRKLISPTGACLGPPLNFLPRSSEFERRSFVRVHREPLAPSEKRLPTRQCDSWAWDPSVMHQNCVLAKSLFLPRDGRLVPFASGAATQLSKFRSVALSGNQNRPRDAYPGNTSPHAGRKAPRRALHTSWRLQVASWCPKLSVVVVSR